MQTSRRNAFTTVRTDGSLLPADLLVRIAEGDAAIEGLYPESYHLAKSERLNEAATRAWNRLQGAWEGFKSGMDKLPESDAGTTLTRERWLLILFQELGYGRLQTTKAIEIEGKSYPVSHIWQSTPIHLISFRQELDRRTPGARGAARVSPHSLVQELLNRSDGCLWGFVSNGLRLRLLRDNVSLTRAACVEFDLQSMMEGEVYSDFVLLYLLCHQSRVEIPDGKTIEHCWLERWYNTSLREGTRVLDRLRDGVEKAIEVLGGGFLSHPANTALRDKLRAGGLSTQDYYRQVLRIVYRLLFLFVAEDRDLLLLPAGNDDRLAAARDLYTRHYSTQRLRRLAERRRSARHADLYRALRLVFAKLHSGCPELALPALGSYLFSPAATPDLDDADIANADLLAAVWNLTFTAEGNVRRSVDYRNLGSEELGSVYESLLEMHPDVHLEAGQFELHVAAGSERKTTGSYYTPTSLVNCLLDSALEPILNDACKKPDPEKALLDLKVCDPACGSGHFLIAAAHRIAKRLAAIRAGENEPAPESIQHALRDVISHCIYGVDMNPMAVELCKVNLWIEALEPGKPLSFIDHHIKCGNSLLGTTPALMQEGIPDEAFKPIEGDIKGVCDELKKQNREERKRRQLFMRFKADRSYPWDRLGNLAAMAAQLEELNDDDVPSQQEKQKRYEEFVSSAGYEHGRLLADLWCAAFMIKKDKSFDYGITESIFRDVEKTPHELAPWLKAEVKHLADEYGFFHWHLEFPAVFRVPGADEKPENERMGWSGGFDCVLGNPPWEQVEIDSGHERSAADRLTASIQHFISHSGRYPLTGSGRKNLYALFAETSLQLRAVKGQIGQVYPTGIVQDEPAERLAVHLFRCRLVHSLFDFENRKVWFPDVHQQYRFCLLTVASESPRCTFVWDVSELAEITESSRAYSQTYEEIASFCGSGFKVPMFKKPIDARIATTCHTRGQLLGELSRGQDPPITSGLVFNFGSREKARKVNWSAAYSQDPNMFRVYEGEYIHQFDHRYANFNGTRVVSTHAHERDSEFSIDTATYLPKDFVQARLRQLAKFDPRWIVVMRRQARATDSAIGICAVIPPIAVEGSLTAFFPAKREAGNFALELCANLNSFALNYLLSLRQSGPNVNKGVYEQIPVLVASNPSMTSPLNSREWLAQRILELVYTAWDLGTLGLDCGYDGPPFRWDEERRFQIRRELDSAFFHLYLGSEKEWKQQSPKELLTHFPTPRQAVDYIMETFPIIKRADEQAYGCYRTKDTILEIYDEMAEVMQQNAAAQAAGRQPTARYQTRLDPPPGPPTDAAGNFIPMSQWDPTHWPKHIHPPREHDIHGGKQK